MTDFFEKMDENYAKKHFPTGSVFESATKTIKRTSIFSAVFIAVFDAAVLLGLVWAIGRAMELKAEGRDDMMGVSIGICGFLGVVFVIFLVLLWFIIKQTRKKREDYVAASAKRSKLPESEIEEFDRQALALDCYILKLTAGLDRLLSTGANKDGLLTRDYIYLADAAQTVIRVDSLRACCFYDYTYFVNVGKRHKTVHCLAIYLLASNGVSTFSDTTKKAGEALMAILKERNSQIDTNGGEVLPEGRKMDEYRKRILESHI